MASNTLTITDNRTATNYSLPIENGTIKAMDLRKIKTGPEDFGLMTYDPAFMNTASCRSAITFIDGDKGILRYRGYPIEVLAEHCTFLEVAYLLLFGDLPNPSDLKNWVNEITHHTMLHENTKQFMEGFRHDAHPMAMLVSTVAALSAIYPEARQIQDPAHRGHVVPAQSRLSVCLSGQRSQLSGKFHEHVEEDGGAEVCGQSRVSPRVGHSFHSARRPRAELQHQRHARRGQLPGRSLPVHRSRGLCPGRTSARRSQ